MIGQTISHYHILEMLGVGGMGVVYKAEDTRLGRRVALKALAPQFTSQEQHRERLRREARAAAALAHPGVAAVYALEEFDGKVLRSRRHPLVGPASMHCAMIQGGAGLTTYAPACELKIERRTLPGETSEGVLEALRRVVCLR